MADSFGFAWISGLLRGLRMVGVVLLVNGEAVAERVLTGEFLRVSAGLEADAPGAGGVDADSLQATAVRNVVRRVLLCQAAVTEGLQVTDAEADAERRLRWGSANNAFCGMGVRDGLVEELLVQRMSAVLTRHVPRAGRREVEEEYRMRRREFFLPEAVDVAHIVRNVSREAEEVEAWTAMEQAEGELARGRAFAQVADRYSDCKGVGGVVGWVARGEMVAEFEEAVFGLGAGQRSGVFRTVFGLHLATVRRRRAAGYRPFDEVRGEIAARMLGERRERVLAQAVAAMERASEIRFVEDGSHG